MKETQQATAILLFGLPMHFGICYYFVHVLNFGVIGLAFAINITYTTFLVVITLYCLLTSNSKIREAWVPFSSESLEGWSQVLELGVPGVFVYFIDFGSFEAIALMSGLIGIVELSTMGIVLIANQIFTCTAYGMQFTVTVFIGKSIGAQNIVKAKTYAMAAVALVMIAEVTIITFMLLTRNSLCQLFTTDPAVLMMFPKDITYNAIFIIPDSIQLVTVGILKSLGMQKQAFYRSLIGQFFVGIPMAYYLGIYLGYGNPGLWMGLTIGNSVLAILYV